MSEVRAGHAADDWDIDMDVVVSPWTYNPSSFRQRIPICLLACVAFVIATYMALYQWRLVDDVWDPVFGEQSRKVLDSDVAKQMHAWIGIPDAALGALAYLGDAIFGLAGSTRRWQYRPWMVILFGLDVIPLGIVGAVLVLLQATVVGHWCFLCIVTAVISLILVWLAYDEVFSSLQYLYRIRKRSGQWNEVWQATWGRPSALANEVAEEMIRKGR
jgi:hypothetical protein